MKFAVVEYTTKTGGIWRHTPEHPNYLGDPQREIDPTSFACYTSALAGEHIPLKGLIKPTKLKKVIKRLTGSWPQTYSLNYLQQFDVLLMVHQISDGHEITAAAKRLKKLSPRPVIIGVPTQPFVLLKQYWEEHPAWFKDFQEFIAACDVFVTVVASTLPEWQAITDAPVEYLPQPYPVAFAEQHWRPRDQKAKIIFVAGITDRPTIALGQKVAVQLQQHFPEYIIHVTEIPGMSLDTSNLEGNRYAIQPFQQWRGHLDYLQRVMLVINTDFTQTRGRVQVDAAAVGTPSLGADSDGQVDLFPDLVATPDTPLSTLVDKATRLLRDGAYYDEVTNLARQRLQKYNYEQSAKRLLELAKKYA